MAAFGRRTALQAVAGAAGLLLVGCTSAERPAPAPSSAGTTSLPPAPDELLRRAGAAAERELLDAYERTLAAHPALVARLEAAAAHHRAHLEALGGAPSATPTGTGAPSTSATPRSAPPAPPVPTDPAAAVELLAAAEAAAADARTADCLAAEDGELARLLASVAACETLHRDALRAPA